MELDGDSAPRRDEVRPEAEEAPENVVNKSHDYRALEREFITSQISLRELCRRHGISAHSLVTVQAKKGKWQEKREAYQQRTGDAFMEKHADRMADRQAEIRELTHELLANPLKPLGGMTAKVKQLYVNEMVLAIDSLMAP